jgi:hypothetical protein
MDIVAGLMMPQFWIILMLVIVVAVLAYLDRPGDTLREEEFDTTTGRIRQRRS